MNRELLDPAWQILVNRPNQIVIDHRANGPHSRLPEVLSIIEACLANGSEYKPRLPISVDLNITYPPQTPRAKYYLMCVTVNISSPGLRIGYNNRGARYRVKICSKLPSIYVYMSD